MKGLIGKDIASPTPAQNSLMDLHPSKSGTRKVSTSQAAITDCHCTRGYCVLKASASLIVSQRSVSSPSDAARDAALSLLLASSATTFASSASLGDENPESTLFRRAASCVHCGPASLSVSASVAMSSSDKCATIVLQSGLAAELITNSRYSSRGCGCQSCCWALCCSAPAGIQLNRCDSTQSERQPAASEKGARTLSADGSAFRAFASASRSCDPDTATATFSAHRNEYASCTSAGETDACPEQMDTNIDESSSCPAQT